LRVAAGLDRVHLGLALQPASVARPGSGSVSIAPTWFTAPGAAAIPTTTTRAPTSWTGVPVCLVGAMVALERRQSADDKDVLFRVDADGV
jgi:hypothetical protein